MSSSPSQSSSSSPTTFLTTTSSSSSNGPHHKWTSFEVRTLISLIIKGEHRVSEDPAMYLADRLNNIVNPARVVKGDGDPKTTTAVLHNPHGDIAPAEVQKMLNAVMLKKKHAVDLCERHPTGVLTRKKMRAFARTFASSFVAGEERCNDATETEVETASSVAGRGNGGKPVSLKDLEKRERFQRRREREMGTFVLPTPRERMERKRLRQAMRDRRERNLLVNWGIGPSFFDGKSFFLQLSNDQQTYTPKSPESSLTDATSSRLASSAANNTPSTEHPAGEQLEPPTPASPFFWGWD